MSLIVDWLTIDSLDPARLSRFWADALDYKILFETEEEVLIGPDDGSKRRLNFLRVEERKDDKNRVHLDLRPHDQEAEVARLENLGATRVDIGQGQVTWVVMADPEGNEFCVLRTLTEEERSLPWGD